MTYNPNDYATKEDYLNIGKKTEETVEEIIIEERICGLPQRHKLYLTVGRDFFENDLFWAFVPCPPPYVDIEAMGIHATGMSIIPRWNPTTGEQELDLFGNPIYDLWDWIGAQYEITDFLYEIRQLGLHQLMPASLSFDLLSPASYYIAVHSKAYIHEGKQELAKNYVAVEGFPVCPANLKNHVRKPQKWIDDPENCSGLWINDMDWNAGQKERKQTRKLPCGFEYEAYATPKNVEVVRFPGVILQIPLTTAGIITYSEAEYFDEITDENKLVANAIAKIQQQFGEVKIVEI